MPYKTYSPEYADYDYDYYEKLNEKRSKQWIRLFKRMRDAREKGDEIALKKAQEAMIKHQIQDQKLASKAEDAGYYWV